MTTPSREPSAEQVALCERLTPRITSSTEDYFEPGRSHPFLDSLAKGGLVEEYKYLDTSDLEGFTITQANGFRDTLQPEKFPRIGIPESIATAGLMWVVMTESKQYQRDCTAEIAPGWYSLDHCFTYWNGIEWRTARLKDASAPADEQPWVDRWIDSELKKPEADAIMTVAQQTRDIHDIARLFGEDHQAFEQTILEVCKDERAKRLLELTFSDVYHLEDFRDVLPNLRRSSRMIRNVTAYQQIPWLLPVAHKLVDGRSFELSSDAIQAAGYHRVSAPSTPEMLEGGENILVSELHPPVPSWLAGP